LRQIEKNYLIEIMEESMKRKKKKIVKKISKPEVEMTDVEMLSGVIKSQKRTLEYNGYYISFLLGTITKEQFEEVNKKYVLELKETEPPYLMEYIRTLCSLTQESYTMLELSTLFRVVPEVVEESTNRMKSWGIISTTEPKLQPKKIDEENDMKHEITRIEEATSTITEIESDESVILHSTNNFPYSDEYHDEYGYHHGINSGPNVDSKDQQLYAQEESDISPIPAGDPDMVMLKLNQDDHIHLTHFESTHTPSIEQVEKVMDNSVKDFSR